MKKCCIIGLGYIGLPTAAIVAEAGIKVVGIDVKKHIIDTINKGNIHIKEPNLETYVKKAVNSGFLKAQLNIIEADIFVITVPTPFKKNKSKIPEPDIKFVEMAALEISKVVKENDLILIESTSPVGTTKKIAKIILDKTDLSPKQVQFAYCPERVLPGNILEELRSNDRVLGGLTIEASKKAELFYSKFCKGKLIQTNSDNAELVKLAENSFRDINIAFANELSIICEKLDINVYELISIANHHPRVNILKPGCGVGGHCIAVDPWFIASQFPNDTKLIQSARDVNLKKNLWVVKKIMDYRKNFMKKQNKEPVIGCLGLSFKPNIDDLRESPALKIYNNLLAQGLDIIACEPNLVNHNSIKLYKLNDVIKKADIVIILVGHLEFKNINLLGKEFYDFSGENNFSKTNSIIN